MLERIIGGRVREKVLLFLVNYEEGYARAISDTFRLNYSIVYRELRGLEDEGVLVSIPKGRTRLFAWNPRYPLQMELRALLMKAIELLPEKDREDYYRQRRRPRRTGKRL